MAFLPFGVEGCMHKGRNTFARRMKAKPSGIFSEMHPVPLCTLNTGGAKSGQQRPRLPGAFHDTLASVPSVHQHLCSTKCRMKFFSFYSDNTPEKVRGELTVMGKS